MQLFIARRAFFQMASAQVLMEHNPLIGLPYVVDGSVRIIYSNSIYSNSSAIPQPRVWKTRNHTFLKTQHCFQNNRPVFTEIPSDSNNVHPPGAGGGDTVQRVPLVPRAEARPDGQERRGAHPRGAGHLPGETPRRLGGGCTDVGLQQRCSQARPRGDYAWNRKGPGLDQYLTSI